MQNTLAALAVSMLLIGNAGAKQPSVHEQLLTHTGLTQQARLLRELVTDATIDNRGRCGLDSNDTPLALAASYEAERLLADAAEHLQTHLAPSAGARLLGWFESDLGRRIFTLEKAGAASIEPTAPTRALLAELTDNRSGTTDLRAQAILYIAENTRVAGFTAMLGSEIEYAGVIASGCIDHGDATARRVKRIQAESIRSDHSLLQQIIAFEAPLEMALMFQSMSDAELQSYRDFTSQQAARDFYSVLIRAFIDSLRAASDRLEQKLSPTAPVTASTQD